MYRPRPIRTAPKKAPDLVKYDLGEFEHLRSQIDIMNVTLKLMDEHAYVLYKPLNEPEPTLQRYGPNYTDVEWVLSAPLPSKRPWRLYRTFGGMGSYADFEGLVRAYDRIIERAQDGR